MTEVKFPYGKTHLNVSFGDELVGVLESKITEYKTPKSPIELVKENRVKKVIACFLRGSLGTYRKKSHWTDPSR